MQGQPEGELSCNRRYMTRKQPFREMLRLMGMWRMAVALGALSISACGGVANSSTRADGHLTVRLAYDANTERTVALGTTITFDVEPIDGQTPEVHVCGIYGATGPLTPTRDPMPDADAVLKPVGSRPATYR